jgi:ANTAR domain
MAMEALRQSDDLIRHGAELRARSMRMRAEVAEKRQKSAQVIAAQRPCQPPDMPGSVASVDRGPGEAAVPGAEGLEAMPPASEVLVRKSREARARAKASRERARQGRSQRQMLQDSVLARLHARLETMPVIEQAKGIIMGQAGCGPEEAFDLLRQASQHANVKVHVLAARMIEQVASGIRGDKVAPILLRQASQRPQVLIRRGALAHEHPAAVHDQAAVMHEGAAAFFDDHDRANEAFHERNLAKDEKTKAADDREAAVAHGED